MVMDSVTTTLAGTIPPLVLAKGISDITAPRGKQRTKVVYVKRKREKAKRHLPEGLEKEGKMKTTEPWVEGRNSKTEAEKVAVFYKNRGYKARVVLNKGEGAKYRIVVPEEQLASAISNEMGKPPFLKQEGITKEGVSRIKYPKASRGIKQSTLIPGRVYTKKVRGGTLHSRRPFKR